MKTWIHRLGSMKIAIVLLVVILTTMAAGTIVESRSGSEAAGRIVYDAAWFHLLLGLFALNIFFSLIDLFPWGRPRIGFVLTHGSMLVILTGALVTLLFKVEGQLVLWEGEESAVVSESSRTGGPAQPRSFTLPFSVRLDAFEIDRYPGTMRPAMFRSRVTVRAGGATPSFPAVIEMNRELSYGGYTLFQSGYQQGKGRDQTVLLVARDPGQGIVFAGYALLMGGMLTVLGTRIAQRRAGAVNARAGKPIEARRAAALIAGLAMLQGVLAVPAHAASLPDEVTVAALRRLPVQHDGRVMPLDTLAREATSKVTGRSLWRGIDPTALVLGWTFDPNGWAAQPILPIATDLAAAIGLRPAAGRVAFLDLSRNERLMGLLQQADEAAEQEQPVQGLMREAQKLGERLDMMRGFLQGTILTVLPQGPDPVAAWAAPPGLHDRRDLMAVLEAAPAAAFTTPVAIDREILYNRVRPSRLAWWILLASTAAAIPALTVKRRGLDWLAVAGLAAGFGVMTWGLAMRWQVAGRIPASNMYESLLFLGWGVCLFALLALVVLRNRLVILNATAMAALTMALADLLPLDPFIHPMPPVLSGTPWLAIHVPIIMLSYSVLALGVLVAHLQIGFTIFAPARRELAFRMNDLLYWYLHVGSILLIAGILTGSIWAASSWGRYWGWDPKEVWSLVAFLAYLAILHGRFDRLIGPFGVAALSIVAFWTILMTYIGVNYVLASGLHSYGFGGSGVVRWLAIVGSAELLFLMVGYLSFTSWERRARPQASSRA